MNELRSYILDPTGHFTKHISSLEQKTLAKQNLAEACGLIPNWVMDYEYDDLNMKDMLQKYYPFGMFPIPKTTVSDSGVFSYPEDPDLYPLVKMSRGEEIIYQYQYGLVAIVQPDGSAFCTRMD